MSDANAEPLPETRFQLLPNNDHTAFINAHIIDDIMVQEVERREDARLDRIERKLDLILLLMANPHVAGMIEDKTLCHLPKGVKIRDLLGDA